MKRFEGDRRSGEENVGEELNPFLEKLVATIENLGGTREIALQLEWQREWIMEPDDKSSLALQMPNWDKPGVTTELVFPTGERTVKITELSEGGGEVEICTLKNVTHVSKEPDGILFVSEKGAKATLSLSGQASLAR